MIRNCDITAEFLRSLSGPLNSTHPSSQSSLSLEHLFATWVQGIRHLDLFHPTWHLQLLSLVPCISFRTSWTPTAQQPSTSSIHPHLGVRQTRVCSLRQRHSGLIRLMVLLPRAAHSAASPISQRFFLPAVLRSHSFLLPHRCGSASRSRPVSRFSI